jgi:pimeloyl-ACP methyl ester carboxylesterase
MIGLSFGGMIAMEVAKLISTGKIIVISSAKTKNEIPSYYRLAGLLGLDRLISTRWFLKPGLITFWIFSLKTATQKKLFSEMLLDADPKFIKWAIGRLARWKNMNVAERVVHIHGRSDRVLPARFVKPTVLIENGGHFMIVDRAKELSVIIRKVLED